MDEERIARLVRLAQEGDADAFSLLIRLDYPKAKLLALSLAGNAADADDIVEETYIKIWQSLRRFRGDSAFSTWRYQIELNCFKNWARKNTTRRKFEQPLTPATEDDESPVCEPVDPAPDPAAAAESADREARRKADVRRALDKLNPAYRILLMLRHMFELSCDEALDSIERWLQDFPASLAAKEGMTPEQLGKLHSEICPRHTEEPAEKRRKRNAFDLKLFHARDSFRKGMADGGSI